MTLNIPQSPNSPNISEKQPLLSQHPNPPASEIEIRHNSPDPNLTDQVACRIPHVDAVATARVHIPGFVALDPIRHSRSAVREQLPTRETRAVVYHIILVDAAG